MSTLEQQVAQLLQPPSTASQAAAFFAKATNGLGLEVRSADNKGKGLFATKTFSEGELVFEEPPLVAIQHEAWSTAETDNTVCQALACSRCFRLVGSVEEQIKHAVSQLPAVPQPMPSTPLPLSENYPLPTVHACKGGCKEAVYCSDECRDAAWGAHHSLLCTGRRIDPHFAEFLRHAEATNDVFRLAAQAVAAILLAAQREVEKEGSSGISSGSSLEGAPDIALWGALQRAWLPFSMGHKALWWEAVALPADVPEAQEDDFRADLKELAGDSLEILTDALESRAPALCTAFPAALSLEVWGSLIGMFELNNLAMWVASPVPLWAQDVEEMFEQGKIDGNQMEELEMAWRLDAFAGVSNMALFGDEKWGCEGNAFYSLQACINHSCTPNAHAFKREQDKNGNAVILALGDIAPGEEITISYIDSGAPLAQRTEDLRDYGFTCSCDKCEAERLAEDLAGAL